MSRYAGIVNGKDTTLDKVHTAPRMATAFQNWMRRMQLSIVKKELVDFETKERLITFDTYGLLIPLTVDMLAMKQDGQRDWKWRQLFTGTEIQLDVDYVVVVDNVRYRVMAEGDYSQYGYNYYELLEDYRACTIVR